MKILPWQLIFPVTQSYFAELSRYFYRVLNTHTGGSKMSFFEASNAELVESRKLPFEYEVAKIRKALVETSLIGISSRTR